MLPTTLKLKSICPSYPSSYLSYSSYSYSSLPYHHFPFNTQRSFLLTSYPNLHPPSWERHFHQCQPISRTAKPVPKPIPTTATIKRIKKPKSSAVSDGDKSKKKTVSTSTSKRFDELPTSYLGGGEAKAKGVEAGEVLVGPEKKPKKKRGPKRDPDDKMAGVVEKKRRGRAGASGGTATGSASKASKKVVPKKKAVEKSSVSGGGSSKLMPTSLPTTAKIKTHTEFKTNKKRNHKLEFLEEELKVAAEVNGLINNDTNKSEVTKKRGRKRKGEVDGASASPPGTATTTTKPESPTTPGPTTNPPSNPLTKEDNLSDLLKLVMDNQDRFPGTVMLTRVGKFYESYLDPQAPLVARLLNLKLASKLLGVGSRVPSNDLTTATTPSTSTTSNVASTSTSSILASTSSSSSPSTSTSKARRIPFCGFPLPALSKHLRTLVLDHGLHVAICEEFHKYDESTGKRIAIERKVNRVVTPGTVMVDEGWNRGGENNWLVAVARVGEEAEKEEFSRSTEGEKSDYKGKGKEKQDNNNDHPLALAWTDVSTGEFFSQTATISSIRDVITRINPKEIVLENEISGDGFLDHPLRKALSVGRDSEWTVSFMSENKMDEEGAEEEQVTNADVDGGDNEKKSVEEDSEKNKRRPKYEPSSSTDLDTSDLNKIDDSPAIILLTSYIRSTLIDLSPSVTSHLSSPVRRSQNRFMGLDAGALAALEIRESLSVGGSGSGGVGGGTTASGMGLLGTGSNINSVAGKTKGTLLPTVRRTVTDGGKRLLADRLCFPSTSLSEILTRHSIVSFFHLLPALRQDLRDLLRNLDDTARTLQRLALNRGDAFDLGSLKRSIDVSMLVKQRLLAEVGFLEKSSKSSTSSPDGNTTSNDLGIDLGPIQDLAESIVDQSNVSRAIDSALDIEALEKRQAEDTSDSINSNDGTAGGGGQDENYLREEIGGGEMGMWGPKENWLIKPSFSTSFSKAHDELATLRRQAFRLERQWQAKYSSPDLELRLHPKFGAVVVVRRKKSGFVAIAEDDDATLVGQTASARSYNLNKWNSIAWNITSRKQRIRHLEATAFRILTTEVLTRYNELKANCRILDELDVALSWAVLAQEMRLVRPEMHDGVEMSVTKLRHPVVEEGLLAMGRPFESNDVHLGSSTITPEPELQTTSSSPLPTSDPLAYLITGPNMTGKSCLLRSVAICVLLAQAGSFVPARTAKIGIVDAIYTRIGARDEIWRDRSTFLVEMEETAAILKQAGEKSLVIMDEVGRGSSNTDGLAISYATLDHLLRVNKSKTLFATHFHEVADIFSQAKEAYRNRVGMFCTNVEELPDGSFLYQHAISPGVCRDSHGIKVAQMAGMPEEALKTAKEARALRS